MPSSQACSRPVPSVMRSSVVDPGCFFVDEALAVVDVAADVLAGGFAWSADGCHLLGCDEEVCWLGLVER
jgi:hypothetical protein